MLTGGFIADVLTNVPDIEVILIDFDLESFDEETTKPVEFDCQGCHYKVFVQDLPVEKLPINPLSLAYSALVAAGRDLVPDPPAYLSDRELATVLASLKCFQDDLREAGEVLASMDHFQVHTPLTAAEIDSLCERLNLRPA
jgi:hypothetical protein